MQERADNITQHMLQHPGGVLIIYKNQSITNHVLKEKITFTLDGLSIRGNDPDDKVVSFELLPNEEKVVQLDTVRGGFTFNMQTQYSIEAGQMRKLSTKILDDTLE